jgi:hypothetical protein
MASSGSFNTSAYDGRYLKFEWSIKSQDIANNKTVINWSLTGAGGDTSVYYKSGNFKVVIDGTTVYSSTTRIELYGSTKVASGTHTIYHGGDGKKTFKASAEAGIYTVAVNCDGEGSWALTDIPRYGTSKQSLNAKTETTIKMNWSSDSIVDQIEYSTNDGSSWTTVNVTDGKSGTYTISGLAANTTYKVKTRIRRKDSQLKTVSSALSVTTYDYPYCTSSPDFTIGDEVKLTFYNPLSRSFSFYLIANGTQIANTFTSNKTTYTGVTSASSQEQLYATIPKAKYGEYQVKVVYGTSTKTRANKNKFYINESKCLPTFTTFTYKDTNTTAETLTGKSGVVKTMSMLQVAIPKANAMVVKNSATPVKYVVTFDTITKNITYSSTADVSTTFAVEVGAGTKRLKVTAYDSRGLTATAYKDIVVYDYFMPTINATLTRKNNFEDETTIKFSGTFAPVTISGTAKNSLTYVMYRYGEKGGTRGSWVTLSPTITTGKYTNANILISLDNTKAYEFDFYVADVLGGYTTVTKTVSVGQAVFLISSNKKKCYLNGEEITAANDTKRLCGYTQLAQNTDLNTILNYGTYRSIQLSDTDTMKNLPLNINGGFTMHVLGWTATTPNTTYRRQELVYANRTYTRITLDGGATWSNWEGDVFYPVGSVCIMGSNTNPSSIYGGVWSLIDKDFSPTYTYSDNTTYLTRTSISANTLRIARSGNTINLSCSVTTSAAISDTGVTLGKFNLAALGTSANIRGSRFVTGYSDSGNAVVMIQIAGDGTLTAGDIVPAGSLASGNIIFFETNIVVQPSNMVDSLCTKFYFMRTS